MAIVRANFTRSGSKIKATLRYIIHRPGREGERQTRELFGSFEEAISKADAYQLIDAQRGMTYFHVKLNFHPTREDRRKDLNLREITRQSMVALEARLHRTIRFLAVEHNDHTELRHIHAIVLVKLSRGERIGKDDWKACRDVATEQVRFQRRALDVVRRFQRDLQREQGFPVPFITRSFGMAGGKAIYTRGRVVRTLTIPHPCPQCTGIVKQSLKTLKSGKKWCPVHGVIREQSYTVRRENDQGQGLEL
jgi:hypothetical protein